MKAIVPLSLALLAAIASAAWLRADATPTIGRTAQVYLVGSDGQGLRNLTRGPREHRAPAWSPDGRRLAFTSWSHGRSVIEIASLADGKFGRVPLSRRLGSPDAPAWSPRRSELAFSAFREHRYDTLRLVATVRPDGSRLRRLAEHVYGAVFPSGPVWSPDGDRIAYVRQRRWRPPPPPAPAPPVNPTTEAFDVVVASRSGGKHRAPLRGDEIDPRWSPDGRSILIVRRVRERKPVGLWRLPSSGRRPRPVVRKLITVHPDWSPDGRQIAFTGVTFKGDRHPHLYVIDARGGAPRQIAAAGEVAEVRPSWSPDGKLLAFADFEGRIRAIAPDGSGERTLVSVPGAELYELTWSPDGGLVAFVAAKKPPED